MPKFYFHVNGPAGMTADEEGIELENLDQVREEALGGARDILSDLVKSGKPLDGHTFVIADEAGETVMTIPFRLALSE
jgi:hypothetical protein